MLSRRCADDGGGLGPQCRARGLALARAAGEVLAARSGSASMRLARTWHRPCVDLPRTPAGPAVPPAPGPAARRGRSSRAAARARSPSARRAAASPTWRPVPPPAPAPAIFRHTAGPQPRLPRAAAVSDLGPATPPAALTVVTVSPAAPEPLCRTLFPDSSLTGSAASSRHGCPGRDRAGNPGALRPPARRHAPPDNRPGRQRTHLPRPAPRPGTPPGTAGRPHRDARPAQRPAPSPGYAA
jgi:hypothetical protein